MAGRMRDDDIATVREKARIDDVVSQYVTLRNAGGGNLKGLCPFHPEKTPSFNVNPDRKGYKCFGCGAGGDGIGFVMEIEGKSFPEAVRKIAELYGVTLPEDGGRGGEKRAHEKDEAVTGTTVVRATACVRMTGLSFGSFVTVVVTAPFAS